MVVAFVALHGSARSLSSATSETYLLARQADTEMLGNPDWWATKAVLGLPATDDGFHGEVGMTELKIAIIVGSTRPGRHSPAVAEWVLGQAAGRQGVRYDIVDLADHPLPLYDEAVPPSYGQCQNEHTKAWAGDDRALRRIHLRQPRVQPLDIRSTQECPRPPICRVAQ